MLSPSGSPLPIGRVLDHLFGRHYCRCPTKTECYTVFCKMLVHFNSGLNGICDSLPAGA